MATKRVERRTYESVRFRISDVHEPELEEILAEFHAQDWLGGRVIELAGGDRGVAFVVEEVECLRNPVVVRIEKRLGICG